MKLVMNLAIGRGACRTWQASPDIWMLELKAVRKKIVVYRPTVTVCVNLSNELEVVLLHECKVIVVQY